jgi:phosphohistidine phosphatase
MKILYLMRHAKSDWSNSSASDFERRLNERGLKAAPLVGGFMREKGIQPQRIVCSQAERAKETARLVAEAARFGARVEFDERIYEASAERLLRVVSETPETVAELMLIGHNPGFEEVQARLTGERANFKTASLARVELKIESWTEVAEGCGQLSWIVSPRDLEND